MLINELEENLDKKIKWQERLLFSEHHLSHAASAFYPSPFEEAAILTLDAVGEWATTSLSIGNGRKIKVIKEIKTESDTSSGIPIWVWFMLGIVILFVIASL